MAEQPQQQPPQQNLPEPTDLVMNSPDGKSQIEIVVKGKDGKFVPNPKLTSDQWALFTSLFSKNNLDHQQQLFNDAKTIVRLQDQVAAAQGALCGAPLAPSPIVIAATSACFSAGFALMIGAILWKRKP